MDSKRKGNEFTASKRLQFENFDFDDSQSTSSSQLPRCSSSFSSATTVYSIRTSDQESSDSDSGTESESTYNGIAACAVNRYIELAMSQSDTDVTSQSTSKQRLIAEVTHNLRRVTTPDNNSVAETALEVTDALASVVSATEEVVAVVSCVMDLIDKVVPPSDCETERLDKKKDGDDDGQLENDVKRKLQRQTETPPSSSATDVSAKKDVQPSSNGSVANERNGGEHKAESVSSETPPSSSATDVCVTNDAHADSNVTVIHERNGVEQVEQETNTLDKETDGDDEGQLENDVKRKLQRQTETPPSSTATAASVTGVEQVIDPPQPLKGDTVQLPKPAEFTQAPQMQVKKDGVLGGSNRNVKPKLNRKRSSQNKPHTFGGLLPVTMDDPISLERRALELLHESNVATATKKWAEGDAAEAAYEGEVTLVKLLVAKEMIDKDGVKTNCFLAQWPKQKDTANADKYPLTAEQLRVPVRETLDLPNFGRSRHPRVRSITSAVGWKIGRKFVALDGEVHEVAVNDKRLKLITDTSNRTFSYLRIASDKLTQPTRGTLAAKSLRNKFQRYEQPELLEELQPFMTSSPTTTREDITPSGGGKREHQLKETVRAPRVKLVEKSVADSAVNTDPVTFRMDEKDDVMASAGSGKVEDVAHKLVVDAETNTDPVTFSMDGKDDVMASAGPGKVEDVAHKLVVDAETNTDPVTLRMDEKDDVMASAGSGIVEGVADKLVVDAEINTDPVTFRINFPPSDVELVLDVVLTLDGLETYCELEDGEAVGADDCEMVNQNDFDLNYDPVMTEAALRYGCGDNTFRDEAASTDGDAKADPCSTEGSVVVLDEFDFDVSRGQPASMLSHRNTQSHIVRRGKEVLCSRPYQNMPLAFARYSRNDTDLTATTGVTSQFRNASHQDVEYESPSNEFVLDDDENDFDCSQLRGDRNDFDVGVCSADRNDFDVAVRSADRNDFDVSVSRDDCNDFDVSVSRNDCNDFDVGPQKRRSVTKLSPLRRGEVGATAQSTSTRPQKRKQVDAAANSTTWGRVPSRQPTLPSTPLPLAVTDNNSAADENDLELQTQTPPTKKVKVDVDGLTSDWSQPQQYDQPFMFFRKKSGCNILMVHFKKNRVHVTESARQAAANHMKVLDASFFTNSNSKDLVNVLTKSVRAFMHSIYGLKSNRVVYLQDRPTVSSSAHTVPQVIDGQPPPLKEALTYVEQIAGMEKMMGKEKTTNVLNDVIKRIQGSIRTAKRRSK